MATDIKANATTRLHDLGQSLWLDNITRGLLTSGTLRRYIDEWSVTGLTSNPTIFDHAIENSHFYDDAIRQKTGAGTVGEALFFELALEDLTEAAALFKPVHEATQGLDGWVSLEVSPLLASDTASTIKEAADLHARAKLTNLLIKIPGTPEGVAAIEASIAAGVPVNVTLLFSQEQYLAAAHAYMRGIERRIAAGLDPKVGSIASVFISRWDKAVMDKVTASASQHDLGSPSRSARTPPTASCSTRRGGKTLSAAGAQPQRLLWASTSTKDPNASDVLYIEALAAPDTINTIPDDTLRAFADHGHVTQTMPADGGDAEEVLASVHTGRRGRGGARWPTPARGRPVV